MSARLLTTSRPLAATLLATSAVFSCLIISSLVLPLAAWAQSPEDLAAFGATVNEFDIDMGVSPENPDAFQAVNFTLSSNVIDVNKYLISWFVNGSLRTSGIGYKSFSTVAGTYGTTVDVQALIDYDGASIRKSYSLAPENTTLLWEAVDSSVPPFYRGKKLPSREGSIRVVAIPNKEINGKLMQPKEGVYVWRRNGTPLSELGGYGKDSLTFQHNRIRASEEVSVSVSNTASSLAASNTITVPIFEPKILFYEQNEATGLTSAFAVQTSLFNTARKTIAAMPYFFSVVNNRTDGLTYRWSMNDKAIDQAAGSVLTLENTNESGSAFLEVSVENPRAFLQTARQRFTALFIEPS